MQLTDLKKTWAELTDAEKLSIIESSNERRIEAFHIKTKRGSSKKKKVVKSSKRGRKKSPAELKKEILKNMSEEERKNFLLMVNMQKEANS